MDPPIGNGFRLSQLQSQQKSLASLIIIKYKNNNEMPSTMSTSKTKNLLKIKKVSSSSSATSTATATRSNKSQQTTANLIKQTKAQYHNKSSISSSKRPLSCNLSFVVGFLAIVILNNLACFIPTTHASASAQRENTRILPLQSGGLTDGGRIGFDDSSGVVHGGILSSLATPNVPCSPGQFRCNDGKCITSLWVCNYQKDCEGGEDEQQSCPPPECEPGQISCGQYVFNKTYCIPPHFRCDMTEDCEDKSDEAQCMSQQSLKTSHFIKQ